MFVVQVLTEFLTAFKTESGISHIEVIELQLLNVLYTIVYIVSSRLSWIFTE